jgi:hypothetical protein
MTAAAVMVIGQKLADAGSFIERNVPMAPLRRLSGGPALHILLSNGSALRPFLIAEKSPHFEASLGDSDEPFRPQQGGASHGHAGQGNLGGG